MNKKSQIELAKRRAQQFERVLSDPDYVEILQRKLQGVKLYGGEVDGDAGPLTKQALLDWARKGRLIQDHEVRHFVGSEGYNLVINKIFRQPHDAVANTVLMLMATVEQQLRQEEKNNHNRLPIHPTVKSHLGPAYRARLHTHSPPVSDTKDMPTPHPTAGAAPDVIAQPNHLVAKPADAIKIGQHTKGPHHSAARLSARGIHKASPEMFLARLGLPPHSEAQHSLNHIGHYWAKRNRNDLEARSKVDKAVEHALASPVYSRMMQLNPVLGPGTLAMLTGQELLHNANSIIHNINRGMHTESNHRDQKKLEVALQEKRQIPKLVRDVFGFYAEKGIAADIVSNIADQFHQKEMPAVGELGQINFLKKAADRAFGVSQPQQVTALSDLGGSGDKVSISLTPDQFIKIAAEVDREASSLSGKQAAAETILTRTALGLSGVGGYTTDPVANIAGNNQFQPVAEAGGVGKLTMPSQTALQATWAALAGSDLSKGAPFFESGNSFSTGLTIVAQQENNFSNGYLVTTNDQQVDGKPLVRGTLRIISQTPQYKASVAGMPKLEMIVDYIEKQEKKLAVQYGNKKHHAAESGLPDVNTVLDPAVDKASGTGNAHKPSATVKGSKDKSTSYRATFARTASLDADSTLTKQLIQRGSNYKATMANVASLDSSSTLSLSTVKANKLTVVSPIGPKSKLGPEWN